MSWRSLYIALIGLLTILRGSVIIAADPGTQQRMYSVACKFLEVDSKNTVTMLARPQVTMLEGDEAVVQVGGPSITLPSHLKERLVNDLPAVRVSITKADDRETAQSIYRADKSATKWQITVTHHGADQVLLDARLNFTDVESVDESGAVIATRGLRVLRHVSLNKAVSFDVSRGDGQKHRIEFNVREVQRDSAQ